ncbi:MAG TPA: carbohydrate ABC transporter permease [Acidimicrobiales bacterium]|nr:carbohydrate ABC transporter permease [Acidimicrobiales bacterium]
MSADVTVDEAPAAPDGGDGGGEGTVAADIDVLSAAAPSLHAATIGKSSARRRLGLAGQYAALCLLAAIVLVPIVFALIQALSPPFKYVDAGKPLHPVAVDWKDQGWLAGGVLSVVVRTLVVALALAWAQMRVAGARLRDGRRLATPRRVAAVVGGTVAVALLAPQVWSSAAQRSSATPLWWLVAILVVAATQALGFAGARGSRSWWRPALLGLLLGLAAVAFTVVAFGAQVWTQAYDQGHLGPPLVRSFTMTVMITIVQVVTSIIAAYAFAFLRFPFKTLVFAVFMGTLLLPLEVTLLANVQTIRELGWINSNAALVAPFAATAFGTFLIRQGFRGVPPEIQDATRLDGYGHMAFLWRFAVPLTRPVIASFTVIAALGAWNQYLWPQAVIDDSRFQTAQIRLKSIIGTDVANANVGVAAALLVAVPVVLLLIAFSRQIIRGLTAGAVKG